MRQLAEGLLHICVAKREHERSRGQVTSAAPGVLVSEAERLYVSLDLIEESAGKAAAEAVRKRINLLRRLEG